MGRPVKIVEFVTPKSASNTPPLIHLIFYEEELKSILEQLDCSTGMQFSIHSVAGPSHDGKSLLLSTLLTCFRSHFEMNLETALPQQLDFAQKNFEWNCTEDLGIVPVANHVFNKFIANRSSFMVDCYTSFFSRRSSTEAMMIS